MAIVYLLHFPEQRLSGDRDQHYLGVAESEATIPRDLRCGRGRRPAPDHVVADVWEAGDLHEAERLAAKFRKQGSRKRLCSICTPGNARGQGTGNWVRYNAPAPAQGG